MNKRSGDALREAFEAGTIAREDVFVTTKLWNTNHRPERVRPAFDASCRRLQVDYVDCYLIHTPYAFAPGDDQDPRDEHGQRDLRRRGHVGSDVAGAGAASSTTVACGSIGLSDISLDKLREIVAVARIKPAVVQVESHPYLPEWELLDFCRENGIVLLAFAALGHSMQPNLLEDPVITAIAERVHISPAQVVLSWAAQRGSAFLTTSTKPQRIQENYEISAASRRCHARDSGRHHHEHQIQLGGGTGVPGFIPRPSDLKWQRQRLMDRVAVITGASRGIGAATALVLAQQRFRVVVNYRSSAEEADEVVGAVTAAGGEAVAIRADVTEPDDVAAMFDETERRWGRVDVLVHNALIPYDVIVVRRSELGAAGRQAGPRTACRVPGDQSCCAGNDLA